MNTVTPKSLIMMLKIMIIICITLIVGGLMVRMMESESILSVLLLTSAIGVLLSIPVMMLILSGWEYFRKKNYPMAAWAASVIFIIAAGTSILFLLKKM